jgi:hypothetical protein
MKFVGGLQAFVERRRGTPTKLPCLAQDGSLGNVFSN